MTIVRLCMNILPGEINIYNSKLLEYIVLLVPNLSSKILRVVCYSQNYKIYHCSETKTVCKPSQQADRKISIKKYE